MEPPKQFKYDESHGTESDPVFDAAELRAYLEARRDTFTDGEVHEAVQAIIRELFS